jgi:hypothetical protein
VLRNASRDAVNNSITSRYGMLPGFDLVKGVFQTVSRPDLVEAFKRSGAGFATFTRMTERGNAQRALARSLGDPLTPYRSNARAIWDGLRSITEKGEESTRLREFARGLEATGGDHRLAAYSSRDLLDFNRAGTAMRVGNRLVPFMNAQIQGLDKLARTAKENPTKFLAKNIAYISAPTLALYAMNRKNPDYLDLPEWRRDLFWNVPVPGGGNVRFVSIPKPFELGIVFGSGVERMARWLDSQDPAAWDGYAKNVASTFLPPFVPAVANGAMEVWANKSLGTGGSIIPAGEQDLLPEAQVGADQGNVTKFLGRVFNTSPRMVAEVVRAQTGGTGTNILKSLDAAEEALGELQGRSPTPSTGGVRGMPFIGPIGRGFLLEEPTLNSAPVEKFYDHLTALRQFSNTMRVYGKSAKVGEMHGIIKEYGPDIAWLPGFERAAEVMTRARQQINWVRRQDDLTREEKEAKILAAGRIARKLADLMNKKYAAFNRERTASIMDPTGKRNAGGPVGQQLTPLP